MTRNDGARGDVRKARESIIRLIHNESTTAVQWYRDPEKRDATSGMVARHDSMVMLYRDQPTRVTSPGVGA